MNSPKLEANKIVDGIIDFPECGRFAGVVFMENFVEQDYPTHIQSLDRWRKAIFRTPIKIAVDVQ